MAPLGSRNVTPISRSHFQIFYGDNYWKGILETFTRWPHSAQELLLLLLAVIFRYSTVIIIERESEKLSPDGPIRLQNCCSCFSQSFSDILMWLLKGNLRKFHQMAPFGSRTVAPASRSHFQIFYSDNYWKEILDTFTRWPNSAPELLLMPLVVIFRYSTVIIERES